MSVTFRPMDVYRKEERNRKRQPYWECFWWKFSAWKARQNNRGKECLLRALPGNVLQKQSSLEVQDHGGRLLQVSAPEVREAAHCGAVDDPVVSWPADVHDVGLDHVTTGVKPGQHLQERWGKVLSQSEHICPLVLGHTAMETATFYFWLLLL